VSHELVVLAGLSIQVLGLVVLGGMLLKMQRESRRFARVLGELVVQESDRIRSLLRDAGSS
jgi:hypothetical protein